MCLKGLKLTQKTPKISKKCFEAKFLGCFSQVQQGNLENKSMCTFPGYSSIDTDKTQKSPQTDYKEKKLAVNL